MLPLQRVVPHLDRGMSAMQRATGLPVSFAGVVEPDSKTFVIAALRGTLTTSLSNLRVVRGEGLGGRILETGRPAFVRDYENAQGITPRYRHAVAPEGLRSIVCLPIFLGGNTAAVVYLGSRSGEEMGSGVYDRLRPIADKMATSLHVEIEVEKRLRAVLGTDPPPGRLQFGTQDVRSELEDILRGTQDPDTRDRLQALLGGNDVSETRSPRAPGLISLREADVLRLAERGRTNAEIAEELGLQPSTVKAYMKTAMGKLGAANRIQAVLEARSRGLLA